MNRSGPVRNAEFVATTVVAVTGLGIAAAKAVAAPISTDEAWSANDWVSRGFLYIWTSYPAANNHVLENLLARLSVVTLGDSEWALRLPAVFGFAVLLGAVILISRTTMRHAGIRVAAIASVALHPYLIDFAACARGYSLGAGFGLLAIGLLARAQSEIVTDAVLALASAALGLSMASVPLFLNLAVAVAITFILTRPETLARGSRTIAAVVVPALAVLTAVYGGVATQLAGHMDFGTSHVAESWSSFEQLFVYVPQRITDDHGYPMLSGPVASWQDFVALDGLHAVFEHRVFSGVLALLILGSVVIAWLPLKDSGAWTIPGRTLGTLFGIIFVESALLRVPWPLHRMWLVALPLVILAIYALVDRGLASERSTWVRALALLVCVAIAGNTLNAATRIRLNAFREWPDNAPVRDAIETLAAGRAGGGPAVTLGHAWYLESCARYYRDRLGADWLQLRPQRDLAIEPIWDFMLSNERMGIATGYTVIKRYDAFGVVLLERMR